MNKIELLLDCGKRQTLPEVLAALAEECVELAHASLKYRRTLTQESPTPATEEDCIISWREEISDVVNLLISTGKLDPNSTLESLSDETKAVRWYRRLEDRQHNIEVKHVYNDI